MLTHEKNEPIYTDTTLGTDTEDSGFIKSQDFGGYEFKVLSIAEERTAPDEIWAENESGDILRDSIYKRNRAVEEKLNISITSAIPGLTRNSMSEIVMTNIMAGDKVFDLALLNFSTLTNVLFVISLI